MNFWSFTDYRFVLTLLEGQWHLAVAKTTNEDAEELKHATMVASQRCHRKVTIELFSLEKYGTAVESTANDIPFNYLIFYYAVYNYAKLLLKRIVLESK